MKQIWLTILLGIFLLTVIPAAMAVGTATLNTPKTLTNYTTLTWNCTISNIAVTGAGYNTTIYYNASGGEAGITATKLGTASNTSTTQTEFTGTDSIESLADALTYNFTCYSDNGTDQVTSTGIGSVGIDNTAPSLSLTLLKSSIDAHGLQTLTWTSTDATSGLASTNISSATPSTDRCPTESWSTSSGTEQQMENVDCDGTYTITLTSTDTAGNTATTTDTFKISTSGFSDFSDLGGEMFDRDGDTGTNKNGIVIVLVIIGVGYLVTRKK